MTARRYGKSNGPSPVGETPTELRGRIGLIGEVEALPELLPPPSPRTVANVDNGADEVDDVMAGDADDDGSVVAVLIAVVIDAVGLVVEGAPPPARVRVGEVGRDGTSDDDDDDLDSKPGLSGIAFSGEVKDDDGREEPPI